MRHSTASGELGLEDQVIGYKLEPASCYYCSTTEGEPELHPKQGFSILHLQTDILHLYNILQPYYLLLERIQMLKESLLILDF